MAAIESWFKNLPVITKSYMTACCVTTLAIHLDIIKIMDIYLNFQLVYEKYEVWRLFTNFLFFGYISLSFIFHMIFLVRHSTLLEEGAFRGKTADFLFMYLFGAFCLLVSDCSLFLPV